MQTFVIRRISNWKNADELEAAASRSAKVGNQEMPGRVRWIRSYVVREADGRLGTVCIYQAADVEAVHEHARRTRIQADDVLPIETTVVVREDPAPQAAA